MSGAWVYQLAAFSFLFWNLSFPFDFPSSEVVLAFSSFVGFKESSLLNL